MELDLGQCYSLWMECVVCCCVQCWFYEQGLFVVCFGDVQFEYFFEDGVFVLCYELQFGEWIVFEVEGFEWEFFEWEGFLFFDLEEVFDCLLLLCIEWCVFDYLQGQGYYDVQVEFLIFIFEKGVFEV